MKKFTITNSQDEKVVVDLVRYFKFKNDCYLIYTMNEEDEKNYLKLYLVRIMEELGFPVVQLIKNENDWAGMQNIIKKVIKEIKCEKYNYLEDLDYKTIDGIKITDARYFKLDPKLTDILASNYFEEEAYNPSSTNDANSIGDGENNDNVEEYTESMLNVPINTIGVDETVTVNLPPISEVNDSISFDNSLVNENMLNNNEISVNSVDNLENENISKELIYEPVKEEFSSLQNVNIVETNNINEENIDSIISASTDTIADNNVDIIESDVIIDYKSLYLTVKKELEVSNQLTDDLLEHLLKYKEKYGELEK